MATSNKNASNNRQQVQRTDRDSARWIAGLLLAFVGFFAASAVCFSYFGWAADQSGLQLSAAERETLGVTPENLCGWTGARLGMLLVDRSFGLFGILLPVIVMLIGVRIIRKRPLVINHFALSLLLVMLLGSLTLGFAFGTRWSLCASTGWGGEFGIFVARMLKTHIGAFGTIIVLVGGWILTGVFINRNFINTVNEAGRVVVDKSGQIVGMVSHRTLHATERAAEPEPEEELYDEEEIERPAPAAAAPQPTEASTAAAPIAPNAEISTASATAAAAPSAAASTAASTPHDESAASSEAFRPESSPFELVSPAEEAPFEVPAERSATDFAAESAETAVATNGDSPFVEVDLSQGRVVMGANGLVELAAPAAPAVSAVSASRPTAAPSAPQGPFTEIDLSKLIDEEPAANGPQSNGLQSNGPQSAAASVPTVEPTPQPVVPTPSAPSAAHLGQPASNPSAADPASPFIELVASAAPATASASSAETPAAPATSAATPAAPASDATAPASTPPAAAEAPEGLVVTVETPQVELIDERKLPTEAYDPTKDLLTYRMPPVTLLEDYQSSSEVTEEEIFENKARIEETLKYFGIPIQKIKATVGPTVTLYEIVQEQGIKISKIQGLEQDIAQSLKALGIRIIAPIPGKGTIGIEVPNRNKQVVSMYSAIRSKRFFESKAELPVVIGRTIQNENYVFDLAKMPHLLVAGATGMGKSVGLNAIITSLLYRKHPSQLKLVMIDPKMVEFSLYAKLERHFLAKMESEERAIITDPMKAVYTLNSLCTEMDNRLEMLSQAGTRNIVEYNEKFTARRLNPEKGFRYLPYIVVVVDEFADLIMMAREVERPVMRLAQKARAVGIHLIIATQRPDVKVITGGIKANFPARIAFRVMQMIDSRTILDRPGANQLIGRGDMLFSKDGDVTRIQCALVETNEVERIVDFVSKQQGYLSAYALPDYQPEGGAEGSMGSEEAETAPKRYDSLFAEIARDAVQSGSISTSMIQRNYEVGFNRAGRIMLQLERAGIVGRQQGAKPRDILFHDAQSLEAKLQDLGIF